jgi:hypothetical protein
MVIEQAKAVTSLYTGEADWLTLSRALAELAKKIKKLETLQ